MKNLYTTIEFHPKGRRFIFKARTFESALKMFHLNKRSSVLIDMNNKVLRKKTTPKNLIERLIKFIGIGKS